MLTSFWSDPIRAVIVLASVIALASTPIAFVLLGRRDYLFARRGRVYRKPEWWSVVCSMLLIMGIPAIVLILLVKSDEYDSDRYEFDPNRRLSVLDQGRQFRGVEEAGTAITAELRRLEGSRDRLQARVAAVDRATQGLADLAETSPELNQQLGPIVDGLRGLRDAAGLDAFNPEALVEGVESSRKRYEADQDLEAVRAADEQVRRAMSDLAEAKKNLVEQVKAVDANLVTARALAPQVPALDKALSPILAEISAVRQQIGLDAPQQLLVDDATPQDVRSLLAALGPLNPAPTVVMAGTAPRATPELASPGPGLSPLERDAEVAAAPPAQRALVELLPLTDIPAGWEVEKSGDRYVETFNANNLYVKIDGRAESFLQYDVKGMAYTFYHPAGDPSAEVQLYVFDMSSPLKALGKYGSEKPDQVESQKLGAEGYSAGASVFFHAKKYYVQLVATNDGEPFKQFALAIAARISNQLIPGSAPEPADESIASAAPTEESPAQEEVGPEALFALLPEGSGKSNPKYVAQDGFGYSFLSDVFMADYTEGDATWQAFVRTYPDAASAAQVFQRYRDEAAEFGAQTRDEAVEGTDAAFRADNFGQIDLVFLKGNAVAGVNGATKPDPVPSFVATFAAVIPTTSPFLPAEPPAEAAATP